MYAKKEKTEILRTALQKIQNSTPITSIGPGSVARSLSEVVVNEIGDFYAALDFNTSMSLISTAQGRALDMLGELYNVRRKDLGEVASIDQRLGSFYFYLDAPAQYDITIPEGTIVYTNDQDFIGDRYSYATIGQHTIAEGRTRVFSNIRPLFNDSVFTAGEHTITRHNFKDENHVVKCTNPKSIAPQEGYESDTNYRKRIIKEVRTSAGGTVEAMRFAGLAVRGVRDVKVRPAAFGLGSVDALVVAEERGIAGVVLSNTIDALEKVRPAGVRMFVREPIHDHCEAFVTVITKGSRNTSPEGTARRVEIAIMRYLNTLLPGDRLVYNSLIHSAMDASDQVVDVQVDSLRVGGYEVLRQNYTPEDDHQIIPLTVRANVAS